MKGFFTFLLYIVLPLAALGALFWFGFGANFGKPHNLVLKEIYAGDIGTISSLSQSLQKVFVVVNQGKGDVTIARVYTDCKCLSVTVPVGNYTFGPFTTPTEQNVAPLNIKIPIGGEMTINLNFNIADLPPQKFSGNLFVEALEKKETLDIPIKASIINQ